MNRKHVVGATTSIALLSGLAVGTAVPGHSFASSVTPKDLQVQNLQEPAQRTMIRSVPGDPKLTFYWGLKRRDSAAIGRLAAVSSPKSSRYRQFQSAASTAVNFGASNATVRSVRSYLRKKGVQGKLDSSRLFIRVVGKQRNLERAFGDIYFAEAEGIVYYDILEPKRINKKIRKLAPERIWAGVKQISLGEGTGRSIARSLPDSRENPSQRSNQPLNQGTFIGCESLKDTLLPTFSMSFPQGSKAYGINKVRPKPRKRGDVVSRPPIGIVSMESGYRDEIVAQAKACMGFRASPYRVETDGLRQLPSGGEGNLDVQTVLTALAGNYRVPVFESIGLPSAFLGPAAALTSGAPPTVLTISYVTCEAEVRKPVRTLADAVYQRLGLIGTSVLAAAGDRGSSGCVNNDTGTGPTTAAVGYPASSPWVTGVGGTRMVLNASNTRTHEYAWNDSPWGYEVAGGGGVSALYPRPKWQPKSATHSNRRSVPDISAHASLFPGWYVFDQGVVGGSSAATPLSASGVALINQKLALKARPPLGLLNPLLYSLPSEATYDITEGNTDLYGAGCCRAKKGYDRATGIGSPNFGKWPSAIPPAR